MQRQDPASRSIIKSRRQDPASGSNIKMRHRSSISSIDTQHQDPASRSSIRSSINHQLQVHPKEAQINLRLKASSAACSLPKFQFCLQHQFVIAKFQAQLVIVEALKLLAHHLLPRKRTTRRHLRQQAIEDCAKAH